MAAPQVALNKLGEIRNQDATLFQVIQELKDKTNSALADLHTQIGTAAAGATVTLQPTSPGTSQTGHAHISGTVIAGGFQFSGGLTVHANNAAAIAAGLSAGMLYRTGADPDFIAIVH